LSVADNENAVFYFEEGSLKSAVF